MHKFEKFLFIYSIIAITIFFISFGIFSPKPLNFISGTLLLPILIYFWLRFSSPQGTSAEAWSVRFLVVIVTMSLVGIYGFHLFNQVDPTKYENTLKTQLAEALKKNEELNQKINTSTKTASPSASPLEKVKGESSVVDIISEQVVKSGGTRITLKSDITAAYIYSEQALTSKKIDNIIKGVTYPFITKDGSWYKVIASDSRTGWVSSADVDEVQ